MSGELVFRDAEEHDLPELQLFVSQLYATDTGSISGTSKVNVHVDDSREQPFSVCIEQGISCEQGQNPQISLTFREFSQRPQKGRVIAFSNRQGLVGYAIIVHFWSNEFRGDIIEIDELFVDGQYRSSGIGSAFFKWLDGQYPTRAGFALQVSANNVRAFALYQRLGFVRVSAKHMIKLVNR